jgi:hypothetical protein
MDFIPQERKEFLLQIGLVREINRTLVGFNW